MMQRIALVLLAMILAGLATAQENSLQLPSCENRCYKLTAEMKGCGETDYACACNGFNDKFYPQYSSCLIEGCAFDNAGISREELESRVCKAAGQTSSPSSSSSDPPSDGATTPAPTSSKASAATTAPGSASSSLVSSSIVSNDVPVPPGGNPSIPEDTGTPSPTSVSGNASPGQLHHLGWTWAWQMAAAAMIAVARY